MAIDVAIWLALASNPSVAQPSPPEPPEATDREAPPSENLPQPSRLRQSDPQLTAAGSRASENAVRQAGDAFGTVVGREGVGLYDTDQVRGFSPVVAGNVRIAGLYFDPVILPTDRISGTTLVRVGPTAIGSPFPAPTGIVDLGLRIPGDELAASAQAGATSFGEVRGEIDLAVPINERLSLGFGTTLEWLRFGDGQRDDKFEGAFIANWRPSADLTFVPFVSVAYTPLDDATPVYLPAGEYLPPRLPRRVRIGPDWAKTVDTEINAGVVADWRIADGWAIKAGLFRSQADFPRDATNLIFDVQPDGRARQEIIVDPPLFFGSTSGEVRLTRTIDDGPRTHQIHAALRGRDAFRRFDGADEIDLGETVIGRRNFLPEPAFDFGEQQRDRVRQWTGGLAYEGRWDNRGELSIGIQRTDYRKRIGLPDQDPVATDARLFLFNIGAAVDLTSRLAAYGGFVTGLEESGIAPGNAANRNEALPAIRTRQFDFGFRYKLTEELRLVTGVFEVSKPYFNLDASNRFGELGTVRNRGIEASLAGALTPELAVNIGTVLLDPSVSGEAVELGVSGPRAVGGIARRIEANADWRPSMLAGVSFDLAVSHRSPETATVSNAVTIPARTLVTLGGRYGFNVGRAPAVLRVQLSNVFDVQGFELEDAGAYRLIEPRLLQAYITFDF
ncbi:TonB-dependent receptor domain-containing protein [Blastomonas sp.]|uniref:TonB-dependent receptor domain-containing protein n=1 Tax=Blastomonas sp. TaxID=1909299 RepID=UPI00391D3BEF